MLVLNKYCLLEVLILSTLQYNIIESANITIIFQKTTLELC